MAHRRRQRRPINTLDPRPFQLLPRAFEPLIQVGAEKMLRWLWVHSCAMTLIRSTTPGGRWLILHRGFLGFQATGAGAIFDMATNYRLDTNELRAVFNGIAEYVGRFERHMHHRHAALYEKELHTRRTTHLFEDAKPAILRPEDIAVEHIKDGSLRRAQ